MSKNIEKLEKKILTKLDWKNKDFTRVTLQPIVGSGPYIVDRIDAGRSITYKRSPNYWAKDLPVNKGRYNFDRLKYVYYRNLDVSFEGFKSRQFNLYEEKNIRNWVTAYHFPAVQAGQIKKYKARLGTPLDIQSLVFNIRRSPLNDIHLRKALTYAYDFEWQNKALFFNQNRRLQHRGPHNGFHAAEHGVNTGQHHQPDCRNPEKIDAPDTFNTQNRFKSHATGVYRDRHFGQHVAN